MHRFKYPSLILLALLYIQSCKEKPLDAETIVSRAYEAHGGKTAWENIKSLSYQKESKVYDADGNYRVNTLQQHDYSMSPSFEGTIKWEADDTSHRIRFSNGQAQRIIGDSLVSSATVNTSAMETVWTALYTVSQPFKLSDPGVMLHYEGTEVLEEGQEVHTIRAEYSTENDNHTKSDTWWYYFDVNSYLCVATLVHHGTTRSYIKNLEYDRSTGIVFNYHRKGYAVDSARNVLFHQSEYFYRNFKID